MSAHSLAHTYPKNLLLMQIFAKPFSKGICTRKPARNQGFQRFYTLTKATRGHRGAVVSNDSLSITLGHPQPDNIPITLATVMGKIITDTPLEYKEGILPNPEGVDLLPANIELYGMEVSHINAKAKTKYIVTHEYTGNLSIKTAFQEVIEHKVCNQFGQWTDEELTN